MKLLRETDQYEVLQGGSLAVGGMLKGIPEYPLWASFIPLYAGGQIGIVSSTCGEKITWIKPKGMNLYVADRCLLVCVSRDDLVASGFDGTSSVIKIDGEKYISRLLKVGDVLNKAPNEWDDFLDAIGTEDDDLLHWKDVCFWGQEEVETMAGRYVLRGGRKARYAAQGKSNYKDVHIGFRPVLVRLDESGEIYEDQAVSANMDPDEPNEEDKGCRYCMGRAAWAFRCDVRIDTSDYMPKDIPVPVKFCPNCGRKLR